MNNPERPWFWLLRTVVRLALFVASIAAILFLLGLAQRYDWVRPSFGKEEQSEETSDSSANAQVRHICPMMCVPPSTEPGRCPVCGMELVVATSSDSGDGISVVIDPVARRLSGIKTETSRNGQLWRTIRSIGSIAYDESRMATISAYIDSRLEKMYVNFEGVDVKQGDDLALVYSPQLFTAQTAFISSLASRGRDNRLGLNDSLGEISRQNLIELGMTQQQIAELEKTKKAESRIRIKSPQSGTVLVKSAVEGDYLKTGQPIYKIANLDTIWLMLDLFPDDAALVRFGQQVEAEVQSRPGEIYTGRVAFIDPTVNPQTRTIRVRVEFLNFDRSLKPGDYATAKLIVPAVQRDQVFDPSLSQKYISPMHPQVIRDEPGECPLCGMNLVPTKEYGYTSDPVNEDDYVIVPRSSVLAAGEQAIVYVETEAGRFEIRRVTLGPMNSEEAVILRGITAGEKVATDGNFLIDSQMQLAGNPSLLDADSGDGASQDAE